jgi:hypothetical protein
MLPETAMYLCLFERRRLRFGFPAAGSDRSISRMLAIFSF